MDVRNPIKEIKQVIPQLNEQSKQNNLVYLSNQNWHNRLKTIETKNLKKYKRSHTATSMSAYFSPCIIEYRHGDTVVIDEEKYKLIKNYMMSAEFNLENQ